MGPFDAFQVPAALYASGVFTPSATSSSRSCGGSAAQCGCVVPGDGPHDHQPLPSETPSALLLPGLSMALTSKEE